MKTGVCSITFRSHSVEDLVGLVASSGLDAIEWGGDIHVPHGNVPAAKRARQATLDAGLETSSYGSYFSPLDAEGSPEDFSPVLDSALALETDVIRIWAGKHGSDSVSNEYRSRLSEQAHRVAEAAAAENVRIAFEFHANTLTDTNESALDLLRGIKHPNLYSYWQPPYWCDDMDYRFQGLEQLGDRLLNLHVFQWDFDASAGKSWGEAIRRLPLSAGAEEWRSYLSAVPEGNRFALLEFTCDDSPEQFLLDAFELKEWVESKS